MAATTSIEWTECTWNPVIGCRRVSPGCERCYAETMAGRIARMGGRAAERYLRVVKLDEGGKGRGRWNGRFEFVPSALAAPLQWRKPCRVFVNSMSDLFGEGVTDEQIAAVFGVMTACPQHTFQVLTKRPERMVAWFKMIASRSGAFADGSILCEGMAQNIVGEPLDFLSDPRRPVTPWPLRNVWIGVSVEDQQRADERVPLLLQVPAAVRFLSVEPLLGAVDLATFLPRCECDGPFSREHNPTRGCDLHSHDGRRIDWVIVGGESGPGARPCDVAWVRSIVEQCKAAAVPAFVKQLGAVPFDGSLSSCGGPAGGCCMHDDTRLRLRDKKGGDPSEWPEDLRVRQFPAPAAP